MFVYIVLQYAHCTMWGKAIAKGQFNIRESVTVSLYVTHRTGTVNCRPQSRVIHNGLGN